MQPVAPQNYTPAIGAAETTATLTSIYSALNKLAVATYNKGVAQAQAWGVAPPAAPMLTLVNEALIAQLQAQAAAGNPPTDAQWAQILYQVPYLPLANPPAAPAAVTYTIGASIAPGVFQVSDSNNSQIPDGTKINASNMATPDGHSYIAHWTTPFGSVVAQMVS